MEKKYKFSLELPQWAIDKQENLPLYIESEKERVRIIIDFSRENFKRETGGPFAAGVFEKKTGKRIVVGVNRVMPERCSTAHAEVMAISLAQQILGTFDLGNRELPEYELVVNWRPCIMCIGALIWSGVKYLTIAGDGEELETITGFDEGPVSENWIQQLSERSISVTNNILRDEAIEVFKEFNQDNKYVYNASR